jgi:methylmalonyl-CoA mutase cobalamin-binding subunit
MAGILAVAAQRLGSAWEQDDLCFVEVSLGLVTLQRLLHEFAPQPLAAPLAERRMLLVPMPGEAHSFGLRMLGIRFQQAGWDCRCDATMPEEALLHLVAAERFHVVGLSVQASLGENHAPELIRRLRKASREPGLCILLGGAPFAAHPEKALAAGADLPALPFTELFEALERRIPVEGS